MKWSGDKDKGAGEVKMEPEWQPKRGTKQITYQWSEPKPTLGYLRAILDTCEAAGISDDTKVGVSAGNDQRDGSWCIITVIQQDEV